MIADRDAVLRAHFDVPAGWASRELEAKLEIDAASGQKDIRVRRMVASGSSASDPSTAFTLELPAEALDATGRFVLSMIDPTTQDTLARFPASGFEELRAEETGVLKVHLVPFEVNGFMPDTSAAVVEGYRDALFAVYPVTGVTVTVGDVISDFNDAPLDMGDLLVHLGIVQEQIDKAPQDTYYYGMVTGAATREGFCDSCPTGTSESGLGIRAAFSVGAAFGDQRAEDTLIHEMGHMHGLLHAPCGNADNTDPLFPHQGADIAVEGYDVRTGEYIPADHKDMMGYCFPRWVSDYHYAKLVDWVQFATASWSDTLPFGSQVAPDPGQPRLPHRCYGPETTTPAER